MNKNAIAINVKIINTGSNTAEITQIAAIWQEETTFKSVHFYIRNQNKKTKDCTSLEDAMVLIDKIVGANPIIIFNNQEKEEDILKSSYEKFGLLFKSQIYDITKKASSDGIVKTNLTNLTKIYDVFRKNTRDLPQALYKARQVYLIASKMFE